MTFTRGQVGTAWVCFAAMGLLVLCPPWRCHGDARHSWWERPTEHAWLWDAPVPASVPAWSAGIWWERLNAELLVVATGMLLLLFLREARERTMRAATVRAS